MTMQEVRLSDRMGGTPPSHRNRSGSAALSYSIRTWVAHRDCHSWIWLPGRCDTAASSPATYNPRMFDAIDSVFLATRDLDAAAGAEVFVARYMERGDGVPHGRGLALE